jgi:hypothetical protein
MQSNAVMAGCVRVALSPSEGNQQDRRVREASTTLALYVKQLASKLLLSVAGGSNRYVGGSISHAGWLLQSWKLQMLEKRLAGDGIAHGDARQQQRCTS